jgi:hypothetical protein
MRRQRITAGYRDMEYGLRDMLLRYLYVVVDRVTGALRLMVQDAISTLQGLNFTFDLNDSESSD